MRITSKGPIDSLIPKAKALVDCTPSSVGKYNKERLYQKSNVKVIFQAGEEPTIAETPAFFSVTDFEKARKSKYVRMASPLAVSIARTVLPLKQQFDVKKVTCSFVRAGSETMRAHQGPVGTIVPESTLNLGRVKWELNQIFKEVNISLSSVRVPSIS